MNEPRHDKALDVLADYFDELLADSGTGAGDHDAPTPAEPTTPEPAGMTTPEPADVLPEHAALGEVSGAGTLYRAVAVNGFRVLVAEEAVARVVACPEEASAEAVPPEITLPGEDQPRRCADMATLLGIAGAQREPVSHLLLARNCRLALRLPGPGAGVRIDDASVTWRGEGGARPWLGGTLREQRSVFLDLEGLHGMLD